MSLILSTSVNTVAPAFQPMEITATPDTTAGRSNYTVRFVVTVDGDIIATYDTTLNSDGKFVVDIAEAMQSVLTPDIPTSSESEIISAANSIKGYTVTVYEYWDVGDILTLQSGSIATSTKYAIMAAYKKTSALDFMTDKTYLYKNDFMYLGFETDETTGIYAKINGSTVMPLASGETITKVALIPLNSSVFGTGSSVTVQMFDSADAAISKLLTLNIYDVCYPRPITLQFLNKYGIIDSYTFTDYTHERKATREQSLYGQDWQTHTIDIDRFVNCYGKYESESTRAWLVQLFQSRYVYENGDVVSIVTDNYVDIDNDLWKPIIQVQQKGLYLN